MDQRSLPRKSRNRSFQSIQVISPPLECHGNLIEKAYSLIFLLIMIQPNTILWSKRSLRQLRKFPAPDARRIYRKASQLKMFPDCQNIKRLTGLPYQFRLRIGKYRLMFDYDGQVRIVSIEEVKLRDENTY